MPVTTAVAVGLRNNGALGGSAIPNKSDAFVWLDGTISGNNFVDKISGRLFPIANKDFPEGWTKGFPYKSAATFSAPTGDAALIAKDVDGFFYTAGVPNQIPVNACFQDVDYAHRLFFRHISQSVDIDTYAETYEPRVAEMVLYNTAATGSDLTARNTYFTVPAEITTAVKWVDPVNGLNTNTGTKASPWQTLTKAETSATLLDIIYVKSGVTIEPTYWRPKKTLTYKAVGNVTVRSVSTTYVCLCETPNGYNLDGFTFDGEGNTTNVVLSYYSANYNKCRFINHKQISDAMIGIQSGNPVFTNCIIAYGLISALQSASFATCHISSRIVPGTDKSITLTNPRLVGVGLSNENMIASINAYTVSILGGDVYVDGLQSFIKISSVLSATQTLSISNTVININSIGAAFIYSQTGAWKSININSCEITSSSDKNIIENQGGSSFEMKDVVISTPYSTGIKFSKTGTNLATAKIETAAIDCSSLDSGYTAGVGREDSSSSDNTLTSTIITETASYGPNYNNDALAAPHGIFVGFQAGDVKVNYNRNIGVGSSYVFKGNNTDYAVSDCGYNLSVNDFIGLVLSGSKNVFTHNKIIINPKQKAFILYANVAPNGSTGATVKNYIVVSPSVILWDVDQYSLSGLNTDYNIYYCPIAKPFIVAGVAKTFAEWQSLGYDTHSVMLSSLAEAKALFVDYDNMNFALSANSAAIGFGQNLGEPYNVGLDASTDFGSKTRLPSVVTKLQPAVGGWDCGPYIH